MACGSPVGPSILLNQDHRPVPLDATMQMASLRLFDHAPRSAGNGNRRGIDHSHLGSWMPASNHSLSLHDFLYRQRPIHQPLTPLMVPNATSYVRCYAHREPWKAVSWRTICGWTNPAERPHPQPCHLGLQHYAVENGSVRVPNRRESRRHGSIATR